MINPDEFVTDGLGDTRRHLQRVEPQSTEEAVLDALRDAIRLGTFPPGKHLPQHELASQLGVSRIPLRDALRRLELEGMVRIDGRRGAYVTALDAADIEEIYELRILLEQVCVRYAVDALGETDIERLVALSEEMDRLGTDPSEGSAARRAFYTELYAHAGRPRMVKTILQLRENVDRYHLMANRQHSHDAHEELRRCIRERDGAGAARVTQQHLEEAKDDLLRSLAKI